MSEKQERICRIRTTERKKIKEVKTTRKQKKMVRNEYKRRTKVPKKKEKDGKNAE